MINQVLAFQRVVGAYPAPVLVGEGVIGQVLAVALGVDARAHAASLGTPPGTFMLRGGYRLSPHSAQLRLLPEISKTIPRQCGLFGWAGPAYPFIRYIVMLFLHLVCLASLYTSNSAITG